MAPLHLHRIVLLATLYLYAAHAFTPLPSSVTFHASVRTTPTTLHIFGFGKKEPPTSPPPPPPSPPPASSAPVPVTELEADTEPFFAVRGGEIKKDVAGVDPDADPEAPPPKPMDMTGVLTDPNEIPGRIVLNAGQIEQQKLGLAKLERKYAQRAEDEFNEKEALVGWTKQAEMYNGRFAMFFIVVGLLTEYWTGVSFTGQIEEMLRVTGFIGMG